MRVAARQEILKRQYNQLLVNHEAAERFFADPDIPVPRKLEGEEKYKKLLGAMAQVVKELELLQEPYTLLELEKGFAV
jgi:hypothetical protein